MTHLAEFSLDYPTPAAAERVAASLRPEVGDIEDDRTRTRLERNGNAVTVSVEADDLVALRAGLNTWLTLADVAERAGSPPDG